MQAARASSFSYNARWEVATAVAAPHELSLKLVPGNRQDSAIFNLNAAWDAAAAKDSRKFFSFPYAISLPLFPSILFGKTCLCPVFLLCAGRGHPSGVASVRNSFFHAFLQQTQHVPKKEKKRQETKRKGKRKCATLEANGERRWSELRYRQHRLVSLVN